jgi:hypothetical protein
MKYLKESKKDIVILLYDSGSKFIHNHHASFLFENFASVFDAVDVKGVEFAYIDVNNGTLAPELTREDPIYPHVQVMPANGKDKIPYSHTNFTEFDDFLNFFKNNVNADIKKVFEYFNVSQDSEEDSKSEDAGKTVEPKDDNREKKEDL